MEGCCRCVRGAGACTCQYNALHTPVQGDHKRHYHSSLARTYTSTSANLQLRSLRSNLKCKSGTLDQLRSHHCTCTSCVCTAAFVPLPGRQGPCKLRVPNMPGTGESRLEGLYFICSCSCQQTGHTSEYTYTVLGPVIVYVSTTDYICRHYTQCRTSCCCCCC
eukprot:scpid97608/ scgid4195/ 